jgi:outer membrane protein assembly factor BamB
VARDRHLAFGNCRGRLGAGAVGLAISKRNLTSLPIVVVGVALLLGWWAFFSRAPRAWRFGITLGLVLCLGAGVALFRIRGVSGDLVPILEYRWAQPASAPGPGTPATSALASTAEPFRAGTNDFPQFYGPNRDGVLPGPNLETNWTAHPPVEVWRRKVGAAWSGFVIVGDLCLTQEQRGDTECVVAYDLATGRERWIPQRSGALPYHHRRRGSPRHACRHFQPRVRGRFDRYSERARARFRPIDLVAQCRGRVGGKLPEWGFTSSPLVVDGRVIVHGGEGAGKLLFAFDADDGQPDWSAGTANPSYASPTLATLADTRQILAFTRRVVSGHDPATGATLWELPYESGNVVCATPVVVDANHVLFSSGYGRGSDLIELTRKPPATCRAPRLENHPHEIQVRPSLRARRLPVRAR